MSPMRTRGVESMAAAELPTAEWDALADRVEASPFLRPGWVLAWNRAFGRGKLELLVIRRAGEVVGVLPTLNRRGIVSSPTNWHSPTFGPLADDASVEAELAQSVADRAQPWFDLSFLESTSSFVDQLQGSASRHLTRVIQRQPVVKRRMPWEEFLKSRSKSRMSGLRRLERRLREHGEITVEALDGSEGLQAALDIGFSLEASGWKSDAGTAIVQNPKIANFYREVADWAAERGELRLWFIRLDGKSIAFAYCIEANGSLYELKVGHDESYRHFAPGLLLTRARLRHVFESGLDSYEFLGGPDDHKMQWADECRDRLRVQGFRPGIRGSLARLTWERGRPVARFLLAKRPRARPLRRAVRKSESG